MSEHSPIACAILLAGGSGSRMQGSVDDKILHYLAGKPIWRHSFDSFKESACIQNYVIVFRNTYQREQIEEGLSANERRIVGFVEGGKERQDSVWKGLQAVPQDIDTVLIHDCARPLITSSAIQETCQAAQQGGASCVVQKTTDTIKRATKEGGLYHLETVDRSKLWSMETPQAFSFPLIRNAYQRIIESGTLITDDLAAIESTSHPVHFVENPRPNIKITTAQDLDLAEFFLSKRS